MLRLSELLLDLLLFRFYFSTQYIHGENGPPSAGVNYLQFKQKVQPNVHTNQSTLTTACMTNSDQLALFFTIYGHKTISDDQVEP